MADTSATERMRRYRQRQRDEAQRHSGRVALRNVFVTPAAYAMLAILAEQYGDPSGAIEEAIRRLHAAHYRAVTGDVTATSRGDRSRPAPRVPRPDQAERRAELVAKTKELHEQGLTANAIASRFNAENVPTLSGHGRWRHPAIQGLLAEAAELCSGDALSPRTA